MEFFEATAAQLSAISRRHGLTSHSVVRLPSNGIVHTVYALSEDVVLRVPRDVPEGIADTRTEAVAAPVARLAGVRTPAVLAFDDTRELLPVPYLLMERVHADALRLDELRANAAVLVELGRQLATLHREVTTCPDAQGWLDAPEVVDVVQIDRDLTDAASLDNSLRHAARDLLLRYGQTDATSSAAVVFLHGDAHLSNVLGSAERLEALIDWGDACWGNPGFDLAYLPMRMVPTVLAGYAQVMGAVCVPGLERAAVLAHLATAARHAGRPRTPHHADVGRRELEDVVAYMAGRSSRGGKTVR